MTQTNRVGVSAGVVAPFDVEGSMVENWTGERTFDTTDLAKPGLTLYLSTGIERNSRSVNTSVKASVWYTPSEDIDPTIAVASIQAVHAELLRRGDDNLRERIEGKIAELSDGS